MFDRYIAYWARSRPNAPAIETMQAQISFAKLDADIDRAAALFDRDLGAEVRCAAIAVTDPYLRWVIVLALARLGIAAAPASDRETTIRIADPNGQRGTLVLGPADLDAILAGPVRTVARRTTDREALGRILRTSGTTGEEKRIGLSWRMIDAGIRNVPIAYGCPSGPWRAETGIDTILGYFITLGCWALGNPLLLGIGGGITGPMLFSLKPALIALTPSRLASLLDTVPPGQRLPTLRVVVGGGTVAPALAHRTRALLTDDVRNVYGASECGSVSVVTLDLLERTPGAAGYVLPDVEVEIVDGAGHRVAPGEIGRVKIRSDRTVPSYLGEETSQSALGDGWFTPGDLGRLGEDGLLRIEGRIDDIMNIGGQKFLPAWVEKAASTAPGIIEVAAFSVADGDGVERCWLAIVKGDAFTETALAAALAKQLVWTAKIGWIAVEQLPRNAMGKVERRRLAEQVRTMLPAEAGGH